MGLYLSGIWSAIITGLWIYALMGMKQKPLIVYTLLLVATVFLLGIYTGEKAGKN